MSDTEEMTIHSPENDPISDASDSSSISKLNKLITEHRLKGKKTRGTQVPIYDPGILVSEIDPEIVSFHDAVRNNDLVAVCQLLESGMDPNVEDVTTGKIPLIEATHKGYLNVVKALLAANANVNISNAQGITALHMCVNGKCFHHEITRLFLQKQDSNFDLQEKVSGDTPMHILARNAVAKKNAYQELMVELIRDLAPRCNLTIQNQDGNTAVHCLAMGSRDDSRAIRYLLARKPNVDITNLLGETPLATAFDYGNFKMAKVILQRPLDMSTQDRCGYTYLHYAAKKNAFKFVHVLLAKGCDANVKDFHGDTPLHLVAGRGYIKVAQRLAAEGAVQIDIQNEQGFTPLMCAVDSGFLNIVELLVRANCDVNIASQTTNQTALDIAKEQYEKRNRKEIHKFLSEYAK